MTDLTPEQTEAVQNVVDRVAGYQAGATESTIETELRQGLQAASMSLPDDQVAILADAIETVEGDVDVATVLG